MELQEEIQKYIEGEFQDGEKEVYNQEELRKWIHPFYPPPQHPPPQPPSIFTERIKARYIILPKTSFEYTIEFS